MTKITAFFSPLRITISILLFAGVVPAYSQESPRQSEQKLQVLFDSLYRYSAYNYDLMQYRDSLIEDELLSTLRDPKSFDYPFDSLTGSVSIARSSDHRLRFFSWNTMLGGTMADVTILAQYRGDDGKVYSKNVKLNSHQDTGDGLEQGPIDQAVSFDQVYLVSGGQYIVMGYGKYSSKDGCNSIDNFEIKGGELIDTNRIFLIDSSLSTTISNCFEFISRVPKGVEMVYDPIQNVIHYTEVAYDDFKRRNERIGKVRLYFDGKVFRNKRVKQVIPSSP
jgi:hypothetical protein